MKSGRVGDEGGEMGCVGIGELAKLVAMLEPIVNG